MCCLLPAIHAISGWQHSKHKIDQLTDMIKFGEFLSLSLESPLPLIFYHTSDVLVLHLRRANYQIFLWKSACSLIFNLLTLLENGWVIENRKICTELMLNSSVPGAIIKLTRFKSKKGCKTTSWSCKQANLVGTDSWCCNAHEERDNTSYCKGSENQNEDQT